MRLLVTGGAGFIGSEFVRQAVSRGNKVCVVDKLTYAGDLERLREVEGGYTFYRCDVVNREFVEHIFRSERPEVVVHFAAESHVDRSILNAEPFVDSNVKGTLVLLDAARKHGVDLFVNIATDEVYGELGETGQFYESTPLNPNSPYSVSKAAADMLGRAYHRTYGLPVVTLRPCNNYGPWQYPEKLIPVIVLKVLMGQKVPVYGKGENVREWLYVGDCAEAVWAAIERGKAGEVYNIGSGEERRNIDVVRFVLGVMGKGEELIEFVEDRPGHDFRYSLNAEKAKRELGWEARVGFEEGMKRTVEWFLEHRDWLVEKRRELEELWSRVYR